MNNKFDWNRFCKVVNKDFRNMWPMFGTTMIVLAALPFALWLLLLVLRQSDYIGVPSDVRLIIIEGIAVIAALMAPSRMYRTWNLRNEGIYYAMLPASKLEKFCSALLFSLIVCPLAVYLGGVVIDVFLTALPFGPWHDWLWQGEMGFPFSFDISHLGDYSLGDQGAANFVYFGPLWVIGCWTGYICSVLMFMFTATLFRRHKVLQTVLWLYVIEFVLSIIAIPVFFALATTENLMGLMEWLEMQDPQAVVNIASWTAIVFNVLLSALFGWVSWRRLNRMAY